MDYELLISTLSELNKTSPDIEASGLISKDGLTLALTPPQAFDEDKLGGLTSALLSLGDKSGDDLSLGAIEWIIVMGGNGHVLITQGGEDTFLTVLARLDADLDMIFLQSRRTADRMREIV